MLKFCLQIFKVESFQKLLRKAETCDNIRDADFLENKITLDLKINHINNLRRAREFYAFSRSVYQQEDIMNKELNLTTGAPARVILKFALPILLTYLLQQFYSIVDTVVVGKFLGKDALAGVGSTGSINFMIVGFCMGICMGFVIPVAQRYGAGDFAAMRKFIANSIWTALTFSVIITVIVSIFCRQILVLMNTPENIIQEAYDYILVIFLGIPITIAYNLMAGVIRSIGDSTSPFVILLLASVVNIGFDILSVTVLDMGVVGPALATVLAQAFSAVLCLILIIRKYPVLHISKSEWRPIKSSIVTLCSMGIPMGLQYSITAIGNVVLQAGTNSLGSSAVAATSAASKIISFTGCPSDALGSSMATFAGQNLGAKKVDRIGQGLKAATIIGFIYAVGLLILMMFASEFLMTWFVDASETQIIKDGALYIVINTAFYCLLTIVNTFRFTIQGLGYSNFAIISGIMEMIARAASSILLIPAVGFIGVCLGSPLAWVLADIFLIPAYCFKKKKKKKEVYQ